MIWFIAYLLIGAIVSVVSWRFAKKKRIQGPEEVTVNFPFDVEATLPFILLWPIVPIWVLSELSAKKFKEESVQKRIEEEKIKLRIPYVDLGLDQQLKKIHEIKNQNKNV
jgi:hypothetical protein